MNLRHVDDLVGRMVIVLSGNRTRTCESGATRPTTWRGDAVVAASGVRGVVVVTGTDTGVGKTVVTAAIAATASAAGLRVAVVKPGQTGILPGTAEESDVDVVRRLASPAMARTLATYPHPLAPLAAARTSGLPPLELTEVIAAVREFPAVPRSGPGRGSGRVARSHGSIWHGSPMDRGGSGDGAGGPRSGRDEGRAWDPQPHCVDPGGPGTAGNRGAGRDRSLAGRAG